MLIHFTNDIKDLKMSRLINNNAYKITTMRQFIRINKDYNGNDSSFADTRIVPKI